MINILCTIAMLGGSYTFSDVHLDKFFHEKVNGIYFWIDDPHYLKSKENYAEVNGLKYRLTCKRIK